ncbi:MAG: sulfatase-like hydrolase/transferase [Nannocystaceae bacterium]|nr:sulfatase-like hydrolase/transferase [Nannocystaceae bacterium]
MIWPRAVLPGLLWLLIGAAVSVLWAGEASADPEGLRAKVMAHASPKTLCPGEATRVPLTLLNTGTEAWEPGKGDRLSYHWQDVDGKAVVFDGTRTLLSERVAPGSSVQLQARLVAPSEPGALTLAWTMVREGVRWIPTDRGRASVTIVSSQAPALAVAVTAGEPQGDVVARGEFTVEVTVDNRGCAAWSPESADNLAYHWFTPDGRLVAFDGQRTALPAVLPGHQATVTATVHAPEMSGEYHLQWAMVREGLGWTEVEQGASSWDPYVEVGEAPLAWAWAEVDPIANLAAGELATITVSLTNTGTEAWREEAGDRLAYRWLDEHGVARSEEGLRTELPAIVVPGETVLVAARLAAPLQPGRLWLQWEPVREHVRWFGPPTSGGGPIETTVTPARLLWSVLAVQDPGAVWVGRERTLMVTLRNDGADAWSESTADHLSYRWLDPAGEVVDEGMRTVLPHDVLPGETTTLNMRLQGPPAPGPYTLQVEMVREHVAWFGPPRTGSASIAVVASRVAVGLSVALVFLTIAVVAMRRNHMVPRSKMMLRGKMMPRSTRRASHQIWVLERVLLPGWATITVALVGEVFVELGGPAYWEGGAAVAWSCAAFAGLFVALLPARAQGWGAALTVVVATALVVADLAYLEFFGSIIPLTALAALHHLGDAHGTVSSLLSVQHLWLAAGLVATVIVALSLGPRAPSPSLRVARCTRVLVVVALALAVTPAVRRLNRSLRGKLGARVFSQFDNVGRFGLFGAHLLEFARQVRDAVPAPQPPTGEARANLDTFFAERAARRAAGTAVTGRAKGYNLVVLQVEALSSWARGLVVQGQAVTPYLDAAAQGDAWLALSVYDQTAQGRTSDAEYLVLSSGHPLAEGALSFRHDDNAFFTMAHVLGEHGYASLSAHPYSRGFWNRAVIHPRYGFSDSMFRRELGPGPMVGWGLSDGAFLERMVEPIAALPEPWVTFMITLSLHHPYDDFPDAMEELQLGALGETAVGNYLQAMRHFDSSFARFMGELAERGLADHTVVALYGDHVTGIENRRSVWSVAGWHAWTPDLPKRMRRVPLIIWAPGVDAVARDPAVPFGQIDIGATVLDLLGVDAPPSYVGVSIASEGRARPVVLPDGSSVGVDRIFVGSGRDIAREGACFDLPSGTTRPLEDCAALSAAARDELSWSRAVVEHDLHRSLGSTSHASD